MVFRLSSWLMAALFAFAAILQYNDPDPVRWMILYCAAAVISGAAATRGAVHPIGPLVLGCLSLVFAVLIARAVPASLYARMFDAWEMKSLPVEEAREASGLLIVAAWMLVLAVHGRSHRPQLQPPSRS